MNMRRLIAVFVAVVASSGVAHAHDVSLEAGGFVGGHFFSDTNHLGRFVNTDNALNHSGLLGFRFAFNLIPRLAVEAELGLVPTTTQKGDNSVLMFGYRLQGVVHILTGRVRPFVLVGAGGMTSSSSNPVALSADTKGEIHAGLGVKADIGCNWGLRLDTRVQFESATSGIYFTEDWEIALGLYGLFGKPITAQCTRSP
jgi:hypothetical protein